MMQQRKGSAALGPARQGGGIRKQGSAEAPRSRRSKSSQVRAARRPRTHPPPRQQSPPTGSGRNPTRPGGQNPTRAAKRPKLEQSDTSAKVQEGPESPF